MSTGEEILEELFATDPEPTLSLAGKTFQVNADGDFIEEDYNEPPVVNKKDKVIEAHSQWSVNSNGKYMPVGTTVPSLPAGVYSPFLLPGGIMGLEQMKISSDGIYLLPDMATEEVLAEASKFWTSEAKYRKHGLLYKRGILLWGPPGGGKTVTVKILMHELVRQGGIVMVIQSVGAAIEVLKALRRIEPKRNLITVFEDIDEIISYNGESNVLSMLDGEHNIDNILQLATTNYPERLGARIINRPSRFDRRVYVGMPEDDARRAYIGKATQDGVATKTLMKWVKDTDGMSIAHLRELVASVYCLEHDYEDVLKRLKEMAQPPKSESGFAAAGAMGFGNAQTPGLRR